MAAMAAMAASILKINGRFYVDNNCWLHVN